MTPDLEALQRNGNLVGKNVYVFGHSAASVEIARALSEAGTPIAAILDNNVAKQGELAAGIPVVAPEAVLGVPQQEAVVLLRSRFSAQMRAQLADLGFRGAILDLDGGDAEFSLSDSAFGSAVDRAERGGARLTALREEADGAQLVICPYDALGDVYWALAYLPAWRAVHGIADTAVVVTGPGCREVASIFGVPALATLTQAESDELVAAAVLTRAVDAAPGPGGVLIAHHDRPYTNTSIRLLDRALLPFSEQYRVAVYGLGPDAIPAVPHSTDPFEAIATVPASRSVILAPHAKSVASPPPVFWERFAADHAEQGLAVFTNVVGDQLPVPGTEPLRIPIRQAIAAVEHAGTFAGLRSGLCDVLLTARARKTVVFPDAFYSSTPHKVADFFALPGFDPLVVAG